MLVFLLMGFTICGAVFLRGESTRELVTRVHTAGGCSPKSTVQQCRTALNRMLELATVEQRRKLRKLVQEPQAARARRKHVTGPAKRHRKSSRKNASRRLTRTPSSPAPRRQATSPDRTVVEPAPADPAPAEPARPKRTPQPDSEDPNVDIDWDSEGEVEVPPPELPPLTTPLPELPLEPLLPTDP